MRSALSPETTPAVRWFEAHYGFASAGTGIRQLARRLLAEPGAQDVPIPVERLAIVRSVLQVRREPIKQEAVLVPVSGGFIAVVNATLPARSQRVALAHEIGHTFFFEMGESGPFRPYKSGGRDEEEEQLCDEFAEELLMPEPGASKLTRATIAPSVQALVEFASEWGVPLRRAATRFIHSTDSRAVVAAWEPTPLAGERRSELRMRLRWVVAQHRWEIPSDSVLGPTSAIARSHATGTAQISAEPLTIGHRQGLYHVECQSDDDGEGQVVISLIHLAARASGWTRNY